MGQLRLNQIVVLAILTLLSSLLVPELASAGDANRAVCFNESSPGFRAYLPDCRAYEQVTPPFKGGFPANVQGISETGSQLYVISLGAFSRPEDTSDLGALYQAGRTPGGWALAPFDASYATFSSFRVEAVSSDLASSLWFARPSPQSVIPGVYLGAPPRGPFVQVGPGGPTSYGERALNLVGASQDLTHSIYVVFAPNLGRQSPLWPGDKTAALAQPSLYEYTGTNNIEPRLVGISNISRPRSIAESNLISECGTYLGGLVGTRGYAYNAVSSDGNTVYFTALGRDYGECGSEGVVEPSVNELYSRMDGSQTDAHTVAISEPIEADCEECDLSNRADAEFQGASFDGSKVFFTTMQHLLPSATGAGPYLYEYNFSGPAGRRVTLVSTGDVAGAQVMRVVRTSDDGSHVYFIAHGVLTTAANDSGKQAEEGAENLYVYEDDAGHSAGHLAFIGTGPVSSAQTTSDGRFLIFESTADLTADQEGQIEAGQVFEYDAETGTLVRVSRGEAGYNEDGNSSIYPATIPAQQFRYSIPISKFTGLAVSADGAYVFFSSRDGLTPQALSGVTNVYEYHEGHVFLISDGHDLVNVYEAPAVNLLGTDASGADVYFETADQLVEQDADTQLDVYDARIEGGFPATSRSPSCLEDACQGALAGGLQAPAPPSSSSKGEGAIPAVVGGAPKKKKKPIPRRSKKKHRKAHLHTRAKRASGRRR